MVSVTTKISKENANTYQTELLTLLLLTVLASQNLVFLALLEQMIQRIKLLLAPS